MLGLWAGIISVTAITGATLWIYHVVKRDGRSSILGHPASRQSPNPGEPEEGGSR